MNRCVYAIACIALAAPVLAFAQADPLVAAQKTYAGMAKGNIVKSAEKMPEENYSFKPTPEVRSFGAILAHIANANYLFCSRAAGTDNPNKVDIEKTVTAKADLIKALNEAFAYCDGVIDKLDAKSAVEQVKLFGPNTHPKLGVISFNLAHNFEHYGNLVTYMRMKNLVPPSSER
jgi:uncharacterized damage-inducible protein DinB